MNALKNKPLTCRSPILLFVLTLAIQVFGAQQWIELGPAPTIDTDAYAGRIAALACSPTNSNVYYAAGADGGVWKTVDGGANWTPLTDFLPGTAIGALALDPVNENVIYAGSGEANFANHSRFGLGLYKSVDGGATWTQYAEDTFAGRCFAKFAISPQNPQTIYAAITRAGGFPELAAAKGHPGATGPVGVFRSYDGGLHWEHLTNGLPALSATDITINPAEPAVLYAGIGHIFGHADNGIYKTTDGGDSWTRLAGGLPTTTIGRISVATAPSNPSRVYALLSRRSYVSGSGALVLGAYRSDDAGQTWVNLSIDTSLQSSYGWFLSVVSVAPSDPDLVIMGGVNLVRSRTAGNGWANITPPHVDMHALAWDAAGRLLCGNDGGVHRTENEGNTWTALNDGLSVIQFYAGLSTHPFDEEILLGGTQDNGSNLRASTGVVWQHVFGGDGGWTQIDPENPLRMFIEYQGSGNLYRSLNGGASFGLSSSGIDTNDRNCFLPPYLIDPSNPARMLYGTHRVYESVNGGTSWQAISADLSDGSGAIRSLAMAPSDPDVVYAATNDGNVLVSFNGGRDFELIADDVPGWPRVTRQIFIDPTDPLTMYLAVGHFGVSQIRRTRDGGQSWEELDAALFDQPVNTIAVDVRGTRPALYAGTETGVFHSVDDGISWHRFGAGLPHVPVIDLCLELERGRLIAATQGRGAWSIPVFEPIVGDLNGDGEVNLSDLAELLGHYGCTGGNCPADLDGDGDTDVSDLAALLANYHQWK